MLKKEYSVAAEIGGVNWNFSSGKLATQASGSVVVRAGDTVVLATAVVSEKPREGIDYLPLLVDYEEKLYAAGKIKGSRWIKREGRPSDEAILSGRVIDRSLRPMFDSRIRRDIQVVVTVLSADQVNDPDMLGLNAASAAVEISTIPWDGPIAGVRVGKIGGQFVLNPSFEKRESESDLDLVVSGTAEHIIMVEAGAREVPEEEMTRAIEFAQKEIRKILAAISELRSEVAPEKREVEVFEPLSEVKEAVKAYETELTKTIYIADREKRERGIAELKKKILERLSLDEAVVAQFIGPDRPDKSGNIRPDKSGNYRDIEVHLNYLFDALVKNIVQKAILEKERRIDGRKLDEIRPIRCEVGLLPRVHGSGLFQRGDTQVLTSVTLGGPGDEQLLEDLDTEEERKKRYMHHYNMPGFASGEVAPMRSPGRREVGHGALAERALLPMIPSKEEFPYTLRLVSEVLSSNGSTSMAATCGSSLALMDAGIPIKSPISGIAMGLVMSDPSSDASDRSHRSDKPYKILSDILGMEDGNGHMDFKVAGTKTGITALQLDIKVKGLTVAILKDALQAAKTGRLFILEKMLAVLPQPRAEMSPYAPRIVSLRINPEKIREVIGPGGKVINGIIAETGVEIDIEDDGTVMITSTNEEASKKAVEWIKNLTREVKPGEVFQGRITRLMDFGAFAEILPGQEGLIHISELAPFRVERVSDIVKVGDIVPVKVINLDEMGRINLSRKALLPNSHEPFRPPRRGFIARDRH